MKIFGFQRLTLLDYPGHTACTVFTAGCNLRCPFCHNPDLVTDIHPENEIPESDIFEYLKARKNLLDGVAVTGGEPLIHSDLPEFLSKVTELGYSVKLDTNGCFPDALNYILHMRLVDYVAMDIKNSPKKYATTSGMTNLDTAEISSSMNLLRKYDITHEYRTTVVKELHTIDDIVRIAQILKRKNAPVWYLQSFKNPGRTINGSGFHPVSRSMIFKMRDAAAEILPDVRVRGVE